jgi:hypothetical protein
MGRKDIKHSLTWSAKFDDGSSRERAVGRNTAKRSTAAERLALRFGFVDTLLRFALLI